MNVESTKAPDIDERWLLEAVCAPDNNGLPPDAWFPIGELTDTNLAALRACAGCGVREQCSQRIPPFTGVQDFKAIWAGEVIVAGRRGRKKRCSTCTGMSSNGTATCSMCRALAEVA